MLIKSYPFIKGSHFSPNLIDNMNVERDEEHTRNDKRYDVHPTEIYISPDRWPASEVTDTLRLKGTVQL